MSLGRELQMQRAQKGLSQIDLAKMAGISPSTISYIEVGKKGEYRKTSFKIVIKLEKALSLEPGTLTKYVE